MKKLGLMIAAAMLFSVTFAQQANDSKTKTATKKETASATTGDSKDSKGTKDAKKKEAPKKEVKKVPANKTSANKSSEEKKSDKK